MVLGFISSSVLAVYDWAVRLFFYAGLNVIIRLMISSEHISVFNSQ